MDLPVFYQTAATVSPLLLGGTVLAFSTWPRPRVAWKARLRAALLFLPPLVVTLWSLRVLAGEASPETWRLPVLYLLTIQVLTGIVGLADLGFATKEQKRLIQGWFRLQAKERRRERRQSQPHNQPHKPERTGRDETTQPERSEAPDRTGPDPNQPEQTAGRHS
jgi:hypothetical protein